MRHALSWLPVVLLTALLAVAGRAQSTDAETRFNEKAAKTNGAIADSFVKLGLNCLKWGLNTAARQHLQQALEHEPENEKARKGLGFEKKKIEGKPQWVLDPKKAPPADDAKSVTEDVRKDYRKERDRVLAQAAKDLVALGQYATKQGLESHARATCDVARRYDPLNEDALKGAGWVKDASGQWQSPMEVSERDQARKALAEPPKAQDMAQVPGWTADLGTAQGPVSGIQADKLVILGSGGFHATALKYAAATQAMAAAALGGQVPGLTLFVAQDQKQHAAFCQARHPGTPGLDQDNWVVATGEVEVLRDGKEDAADPVTTAQRIVLAVAIHEVRARCGETTHPWFEVGVASNLARRLVEQISQTPFAGDPAGPVESGRWKRTLLMQIADGTAPALEKLLVARDPDESQAILAHFFTRYLLHEHPKALEAFCAAIKGGAETEAALSASTLLEPAQLETQFHGWVQQGG